MSDALNYLLRSARSNVGLFLFSEKTETHLDIRTRDLISVITKVAVQTEGGFRQYLTCVPRVMVLLPNEVLDVFMAFPVLAKIVWPEILLTWISGVSADNLDAKPEWHDVAPVTEVPQRGSRLFRIRRAPPVYLA